MSADVELCVAETIFMALQSDRKTTAFPSPRSPMQRCWKTPGHELRSRKPKQALPMLRALYAVLDSV